jgi:hypothetical protein
MSTSNYSLVFSQLLFLSPLLVMYVVGIAVALTNIGRYPRPATFVLVACGGMFITSIGRVAVMQYLLNTYRANLSTYSSMMSVVGLVTASIHAGCFGLLLWAAFAGRGEQAAGFPVGYVGDERRDQMM